MGYENRNTMKLRNAILLTLGIWIGCVTIDVVTGHNLLWYIIPAASIWAAIDSTRIQFGRYRYGFGPLLLFFGCCCSWLIGFPWYLWMRGKIRTGTAELKTNDARCVRCEKVIKADAVDCPHCGWRQPR